MTGTWSQTTLETRTISLYEPPDWKPGGMGVLFLHAADGADLRGQCPFTALFDELNLKCVCPHGGMTWWSDRPSDGFGNTGSAEEFLIKSVVPTMTDEWAVNHVALLGISMGGQGALRIAFKQPRLFPVVASISAALDYHELYGHGSELDQLYDSKEQCRQNTAGMHLPPVNFPPHIFLCCDPQDTFWKRGNDRLHEKMAALGVAHEYDLSTEAGGHSWAYFNHMAERTLRFIHDGLLQESRRLL